MAILATKAELKVEQDKIIKFQAIYSSYFCGNNQFEDEGTQNYLIFQPMYKYFKKIGNTDRISAWKSKRLSDVSIKPFSITDISLVPSLSYIGTKTKIKFVGSCLKQDEITYTDKNIVNNYILHEINL